MRPRITLPLRSRSTEGAVSTDGPVLTRRERREKRELLQLIADRPQNVRDELLEMISRPV